MEMNTKLIRRKKIIFFLPTGGGGAQRMSVTIGKMLDLNEFDVRFVIVGKDEGPIKNYIPNNYPIEFLKVRNRWAFMTFRLFLYIKKEKPYKVFCSLQYMNPRVVIAAKLAGIKSVIRSSNILRKYSWDISFLMKISYKYAQYVIAQQDLMRNQLIQKLLLEPNRVVTIHNALDIESIERLSRAPSPYPAFRHIKIVWAARIAEQKGQDVLIKAFKILKNDIKDIHLYLVGRYSNNDAFFVKLKKLIDLYDLKEYVHIVGFDANPYRWMKYCDCYVLPSRFEGLPNSLIEASYLKRPLAATCCIPIISEIIKDGINGYTAKVEDPYSLSEAIKKAINLQTAPFLYKGGKPDEFIELFK